MELGVIITRLKEHDLKLGLFALISFVLTPVYIGLIGVYGNIIVFINFLVLVASGLLICYENKKRDILYVIISSSLLISIFFEFYFSSSFISQICRILFGFFFFSLMCFRILENLITNENISVKGITGAVSGYVYIGLAGGSLFEFISKILNTSVLKHFSEEALSSYSYYYFSFMTITTVGYGDIYPLNNIGQSATILLSLAGQIYLTVVMASFVGKLLSK